MLPVVRKVIVQLLLSWQVCSKEHSAGIVNVGGQHYSWTFWQHADHEQNTTCMLCEKTHGSEVPILRRVPQERSPSVGTQLICWCTSSVKQDLRQMHHVEKESNYDFLQGQNIF